MPASQPAARSTARPSARPAPPSWLPPTTLVLSLLGLVVAAYLTVEHFTSSTTLACPETGAINCAKVTSSSYATVAGIPVAVLGLVYFVAMVLLCMPRAWHSSLPWVARARVAAASVGAVSVLYLVWVELFRVNAICLWCTAVHVLTLGLFVAIVLGQSARSAAAVGARA